MPGGPDGRAVRSALDRVARRARAGHAAAGAAAGLAAALGVALAAAALGYPVGSLGGWGAALGLAPFLAPAGAALGVAAALLRSRRRTSPQALVERRLPQSRNAVYTAAELLGGRLVAHPRVAEAVCRDAARALAGVEVASIVPVGRSSAALAAALGAWTLLLAAALRTEPVPLPGVSAAGLPPSGELEVVVTPPAYTGAGSVTLHEPDRVEVLVGSRLEVVLRATAQEVTLETPEGRQSLVREPGGAFRAVLAAEADGFVSLEGREADGRIGLRRLVGLAVRPDLPPRVRIVEPGRDLLLTDGDRALELAVEATDEFGLASLHVVFTRATGFGERFTFTEGEVPLEITRESQTRWVGRARWPLHELELERGDVVVYHASARDRRPGSSPGESETWVVEIAGSEAALAGGFAGEDDLDRYAMSQQMVIVLIERLLARRDSLSTDELAREALVLAAAQRRVRAEFVFMLGGELEDDHDHEDASEEALAELHEEAHALADQEAAEGRLAQQGRVELSRAVQAMSHAAAFLAAAELEEGLQAGQTALVFLQRAFASSRYILRALTERERLDFSRRLTGALAAAVRDVRPRVGVDPDPGLAALREVLWELGPLSAAQAPDDGAAEAVSRLAGTVLRADPGAGPLREVARLLGEAADALAAGRREEARPLLADAASRLAAGIQEGLRPAPGPGRPMEVRALEGALTDALRGGGGR